MTWNGVKKDEQPYLEEAEYYKNGSQKRYYKKVEARPYSQGFEFIIGLSAIAIALSCMSIAYQLSQHTHRDNYGSISPR